MPNEQHIKIEGRAHGSRWTDRRGIAAHFQVSERTISNLVNRRILPVIKLRRIVRFDIAACEAAVKAFELRSVVSRETQKRMS